MGQPIVESTPFSRPLAAAGATLSVVGGKGASLACLAAAGLPVPAGFHLTTEAYRRFVTANDLTAAILAAAADASLDDPASQERAAATIQPLFQRGAMPEAIAADLRRAYAALGEPAPAVAVRSSATAEDLPGLSFAGQQETLLNVRGQAALLEAVRRCWASLWTARAIGYRLWMGIDHQTVAMGVVIQTMLAPTVAGVLFTANPTTGDRAELLINASYGLGEAIVSGEVTPDSFVVDRATLTIRNSSLGQKEVAIVAAEGQGTVPREVPRDQQQQPSLSADRIRDLGELAGRVEALFNGVPQDIEWAVADGRVWLLQSRPITNLPPAPLVAVAWEPPVPGTVWIRRQVVEHMPGPLSPLFAELYLREGLEQSVDAMVRAMGMSDAYLELMERPFLTTVNGYAYMRGSLRWRWSIVPVLLRTIVVGTSIVFRSGMAIWRDAALPAYLATVARWQTVDPASATDEELLAGVRALAWADAAYWWAAAMVIGVAKIADGVFAGVLALMAPGRGLNSALFLRGFPSPLLVAEAEVEAIAAQIRTDEALRALVAATPPSKLGAALAGSPAARGSRHALAEYFRRYGHQIYTLDFAEPTLGDDPLPVLLSLKSMVDRPGPGALARQAAMARERERLVVRTERSLDPLRRFLFRRVRSWATRLAPGREEALFYVGAAWPVLRGMALELGRRLAAAGSLETADDIFYLDSAEILAAGAARLAGDDRHDLAIEARARHELREARQRLHPPPAVPPTYRYRLGPFDLSGFETQRRNVLEDATLRGFAVSPGRVTAPASVIHSPADFGKMVPGTILVCPTTTPAWTPLFALASGLVTDIGGILAHGSIVAREYGIPAVMGTGTGTLRIGDGQPITVDGDAGTVSLVTVGGDADAPVG